MAIMNKIVKQLEHDLAAVRVWFGFLFKFSTSWHYVVI